MYLKKEFRIKLLVLVLTIICSGVSFSMENPLKEFKNLVVSQDKNVMILRINALPRNAVSIRTLLELDLAMTKALKDKTIRGIVITGTGRVFSAGATAEKPKVVEGIKETQSFIAHKVFNRMERYPKPIIAAVNGVSTNGGNELTLSTDIRVAGESAIFGQIEVIVGLIPGFGGMQRLQRYIGHGRAKELILTGRNMSAKEALEVGLVSKVVADDKVVEEAVLLAQTIADNANPYALGIYKERMAKSYDEKYYESLENDQVAFDELSKTPESKEALARFIKKLQEKKRSK